MNKLFKQCQCCKKEFVFSSKNRNKKYCSLLCKNEGIKLTYEQLVNKIPSFLEIDWATFKGCNFHANFFDKDYNVWFWRRVNDVIEARKGCKERTKIEQRKLQLQKIKRYLPAHVKIHEETYIARRKKATFTDLDYNEVFEAIVASVIYLKSSCKTRTLKEAQKRQEIQRQKSLNKIKTTLPNYLTINESSFKGMHYLAEFKDLEYNVTFKRRPISVLGKKEPCCSERFRAKMKSILSLSLEEVNARIDKLYGGSMRIVPHTYKGTNKIASFIVENRGTFKFLVSAVFDKNIQKEYQKTRIWNNLIKYNYWSTCPISNQQENNHCHHIYSKYNFPQYKYEEWNGIYLNNKIHQEFHSKYGKKNNTKEQLLEFAKLKGVDLTEKLIQCPDSYYHI